MKAAQLREKSADELRSQVKDLEQQLYKLRFQRAVGQLQNPMKMRQIRREIARIHTVLGQKASA